MSIVKGPASAEASAGKQRSNVSFVYFGTPELSAEVLEYLKIAGFLPALIVTNPDRPQGRKMVVTPPPVKLWAIENNIPFLQPEELNQESRIKIHDFQPDLFIVVAYGKILSKEVLDIPKKGTLNIHYSLLPKYRGASPMESAILNDDKDVGVTIMLMDSKMDHGPIVASQRLENKEWPMKASELRKACNELGAKLLIETISKWIEGKIEAVPQVHSNATYTKKFEKKDGEIDLGKDAYQNFLKIQAFDDSIGTFFFTSPPFKGGDERGGRIRVVIKSAEYKDGVLEIIRVVPEGKKEINYKDFVRGYTEKK